MHQHFLIKRVAACMLALCLLGSLSIAHAATQSAVVSNPNASDRLNLRERASAQSESLGKYYNGAPVTVLWTWSGWAYVQIGNTYGYMMTEYLLLDGKEGSVLSAMPKAVVDNPKPSDRLNLRDRPSAAAESLAKYGNGTVVEIMGDVGEWVHVRVGNNTGYMVREYLSFQAGKPQSTSKTSPGATSKPSGGDAGKPVSGFAVVNMTNTGDKLSLRATPSSQAKSLGAFENGTTVELLSSQANWYEVRIDDMTGYMQSAYLVLDAGYPALATANRAVLKSEYASGKLVVRFAPSMSTQATATVSGNSSMRVLCRIGTWYYVEVEGTEVAGYVPAHQVWVGNDASKGNGRVVAVVCNPNPKDRLNLRKSASTTAQVLDRLFNGTQVEVLDADKPAHHGWYRVRVAGQEGYVQTQYLDFFHWGDAASW